MRLVHIDDINTQDRNVVLAQTVIDSRGRALLRRGVKLTERLVDLLAAHGVYYVYVTEREIRDDIPDLMQEETRVQATQALQRIFDDGRFGNAYVLKDVRAAVGRILEDLLSRPFALQALTEARAVEGYTTAHSVSVCALSVLIGMSLGYDRARLYELAAGALLHDVGKATIPRDILHKEGPLTEPELEVVREHTTYGFEWLKACQGISLPTSYVAYQHHERLDGSGYPRGLKGRDIHPYARITAVADVFDAITTDRPYRRRVPTYEAVQSILRESGAKFDRRVCAALLRRVAIFPPGAQVKLSTGERAIVLAVPSEVPTRPEVYLVTDAEGRPLTRPRRLRLLAHPEIRVVEAALGTTRS